MARKKFTVFNLLELDLKGYDALELRCIGGRNGLMREISNSDINRPGLALSGFFDFFMSDRVQLFGKGEVAYIQKLEDELTDSSLKTFFSYAMPCCIFSNNREPTQEFCRLAEQSCCPILQTSLETTDFNIRLLRLFSNVFALKKSIHGIIVEVHGVGILLVGESGVGKSELALELIERGHRLVADDLVELRCVNGNTILGTGTNPLTCHHMEIRGIGIINVSKLFGVGAILDKKEIELVIRIENWNPKDNYDRLGIDLTYAHILGVKIPMEVIPVGDGRNLPIIIETAAINERLKKMGEHSARKFVHNVVKWTENGSFVSNDQWI